VCNTVCRPVPVVVEQVKRDPSGKLNAASASMVGA
jgi:hypothetical protein